MNLKLHTVEGASRGTAVANRGSSKERAASSFLGGWGGRLALSNTECTLPFSGLKQFAHSFTDSSSRPSLHRMCTALSTSELHTVLGRAAPLHVSSGGGLQVLALPPREPPVTSLGAPSLQPVILTAKIVL